MSNNFLILPILFLLSTPASSQSTGAEDHQDVQLMREKGDNRFSKDLSDGASKLSKESAKEVRLPVPGSLLAAITEIRKTQQLWDKADADLAKKLAEEYKKDQEKSGRDIGKEGDIAYFSGAHSQAVKLYTERITAGKHVEGFYIKRGLAHAKAKDSAEALRDYETAKKSADQKALGFALCELAIALGKYDEAAKFLEAGIARQRKLDPGMVSTSEFCLMLELSGQSVDGCATKKHYECAQLTETSPDYLASGCAAIKKDTDYLRKSGSI